MIGMKMIDANAFAKGDSYIVTDLWTGKTSVNTNGHFEVSGLDAYANITVRITPL